jgi:hypothetical protein
VSFKDGLLDVLLFADLSKLDLLGNVVLVATGGLEDPRIQHYHVRRVDIDSHPAMPVMADGSALGEGPLHISVQRHALAVMVSKPAPVVLSAQGLIFERPTGESTEQPSFFYLPPTGGDKHPWPVDVAGRDWL